MAKETELASSLIKKTLWDREECFINIGGYPVTYPYHEIDEAPPNEPLYLPPEAFKSREVIKRLLGPENIPPRWVEFIQQAGKLRKGNGSRGPLAFIDAVEHILEEEPLAKTLGIPEFTVLPCGGPDLRDEKQIKARINAVLSNPILRQRLLEISACISPDSSLVPLAHERIVKILGKLGVKSGFLLDLGCGTGENTPAWQKETGLTAVGLDRQYYERYYGPQWHNQSEKIHFLRADFVQALPFSDNSIEVIILEYVTHFINKMSLRKGLKEIRRVLKNDTGILVVGPQYQESFSSWRIFQKKKIGKTTALAELDPSQLI